MHCKSPACAHMCTCVFVCACMCAFFWCVRVCVAGGLILCTVRHLRARIRARVCLCVRACVRFFFVCVRVSSR